MIRMRSALALILVLCCPLTALADTLYVAAPAAVGPGHPLHLGADHKASQPGDLVAVVFNYLVQTSSTDVVKNTKGYNVGLGAGLGNAALSLLRFPTGLTGSTGANADRSKNGSNAFTSSMMATVTDVLPSGALAISGVQKLIVNGQLQNMTVTGLVRPEDVDGNDSVLSSRIANVETRFDGNFQEKNKGLVRRILDVLF